MNSVPNVESVLGRLTSSLMPGPIFWVLLGVAVLVYFRPGILLSGLAAISRLVARAPHATPVPQAYPVVQAQAPAPAPAPAAFGADPVFVGPAPMVPLYRVAPVGIQAAPTEDLTDAALQMREEFARRRDKAKQRAAMYSTLLPDEPAAPVTPG